MDGAAVGHPPSIAAHGMVWHYGHSTGGGGWHWVLGLHSEPRIQ